MEVHASCQSPKDVSLCISNVLYSACFGVLPAVGQWQRQCHAQCRLQALISNEDSVGRIRSLGSGSAMRGGRSLTIGNEVRPVSENDFASTKITPLVPHSCRGSWSKGNSPTSGCLRHPLSIGATSRLSRLSVRPPVFPIRTPIFPTKALALELFGWFAERAATARADQVQDRRDVVGSKEGIGQCDGVHSFSQQESCINAPTAIGLPNSSNCICLKNVPLPVGSLPLMTICRH